MFGLFVLPTLRAPGSRTHTEFQRRDFCFIILFSRRFSLAETLWYCDIGLDKMHSPRGVEKILPVAKSDLFLLFHSPLVSCSESLHRRWRNYVSFTFLASVTSLLYSHWFVSIQILNSQVHALFLPPPFVCFFFFFIDVFNNDLWHYLGELSDLSLRRVACRLESTVIASRAPGRNHRSLQDSSS